MVQSIDDLEIVSRSKRLCDELVAPPFVTFVGSEFAAKRFTESDWTQNILGKTDLELLKSISRIFISQLISEIFKIKRFVVSVKLKLNSVKFKDAVSLTKGKTRLIQ